MVHGMVVENLFSQVWANLVISLMYYDDHLISQRFSFTVVTLDIEKALNYISHCNFYACEQCGSGNPVFHTEISRLPWFLA